MAYPHGFIRCARRACDAAPGTYVVHAGEDVKPSCSACSVSARAAANAIIAFAAGNPAEDFFTAWLEHGTGGTCWPSSNALFALLEALGFEARRVAGSMYDLGVRNHGSVKVRLGGRDWLFDSSMLTIEPLPLGDGVLVHGNPVVPVEIGSTVAPSEGTRPLVRQSREPDLDAMPPAR
jgi:hypothetical protein